jgi:hypothetical protein
VPENCFVLLTGTEAEVGEMVIAIGFSVTVAEANLALSAEDVALTVAVELLFTDAGAV